MESSAVILQAMISGQIGGRPELQGSPPGLCAYFLGRDAPWERFHTFMQFDVFIRLDLARARLFQRFAKDLYQFDVNPISRYYIGAMF